MATLFCPQVGTCFDPANPLRNLSSEDSDGPEFLALSPGNWFTPPPPLGSNFRSLFWPGVGTSTQSQPDATTNGHNRNLENTVTTWTVPPDVPLPNPNPTPSGLNNEEPPAPPNVPPVPNGPPQPPATPNVYFSGPNTATVFCADGNPFTVNVPAGLFAGLSQAEADQIAVSYALQNITRLKFCLSDFTASGCVGTTITNTFSVTGGTGPFTFSDEGIPPGFSLVAAGERAAFLSGTIESGGTYNFTIRATDPLGNYMEKTYRIIGIGFADQTLPDGLPSTPYSATIQVQSDEVLDYRIPSGSLPPGLGMDTQTGVISGTPTTPGTYPFVVSIQAADARCLKDFSIHIYPAIGWATGAVNIQGFPTYTVTAFGGVGSFSAACEGGVQDDSVDLLMNTTVFNDLLAAKTARFTFTLNYSLISDLAPPGASQASFDLKDTVPITTIAAEAVFNGATLTNSGLVVIYDVALPGNGNKNVHFLLNVAASASGAPTSIAGVGISFVLTIV